MFICFLFFKVALGPERRKSKKLLNFIPSVCPCVCSDGLFRTVCSNGLFRRSSPSGSALAKCPAAHTIRKATLSRYSRALTRLPHDSMNDQCLQTYDGHSVFGVHRRMIRRRAVSSQGEQQTVTPEIVSRHRRQLTVATVIEWISQTCLSPVTKLGLPSN